MTLLAIGIAIGGLFAYTAERITEQYAPKPTHYTLTTTEGLTSVHACNCKL